MALPLKPMAMFALVREFQSISAEQATVAVSGSGTGELAAVLRRELARGEGADPAAVVASWQGATALLRVQAGPLDAAGEEELRAANAAKVPIVAIIVEGGPEAAPGEQRLPYVLATDHVRIGPGEGFPLDAIAAALGRRVGERSSGLAARLPVLRPGICQALVKNASKRNAMLGSVIPVPGADLPVLDTTRLPELLGVAASGLGLRGAARLLAGSVGPGWLVKGAVAYGGTRAIGEAAIRWFERKAGTTALDDPGATA
jgi:hypothetical protein